MLLYILLSFLRRIIFRKTSQNLVDRSRLRCLIPFRRADQRTLVHLLSHDPRSSLLPSRYGKTSTRRVGPIPSPSRYGEPQPRHRRRTAISRAAARTTLRKGSSLPSRAVPTSP